MSERPSDAEIEAAMTRAKQNRAEMMRRRVNPEETNRSTLFFAFAVAFDDRALPAHEVQRLRRVEAAVRAVCHEWETETAISKSYVGQELSEALDALNATTTAQDGAADHA